MKKYLFFIPKSTPKQLLLKFSELNSVESEIAQIKFVLITETKMASFVHKLFDARAESFFDTSIDSLGILPIICDALKKYGLFSYFDIAKFKNFKLMHGMCLLLTTLICTLHQLTLKKVSFSSQVLVNF